MVLCLDLFVDRAWATERVRIAGTHTTVDSEIRRTVDGKSMPLVLTGAALRTKYLFNVYCVASYIDGQSTVRNAKELAEANVAKVLLLKMERHVAGTEMAAAVRKSITDNHPAESFPAELEAFMVFLVNNPVRKGDQVWITHLPGVGMSCEIVGRGKTLIRHERFSRAVWDIYLGEKPLHASIKSSLVSRL